MQHIYVHGIIEWLGEKGMQEKESIGVSDTKFIKCFRVCGSITTINGAIAKKNPEK